MQRRKAVHLFMLGHLLLAVPVAWLVLANGRLDLHAVINNGTLRSLDGFFRYFTHVGDGSVPTILAIALLVRQRRRPFLMVALACGLGAAVVQGAKRFVFADMHRPFHFRSELDGVHWVEGVEMHQHFSFPSGHSAAAFGLALACVAILGRPRWSVPVLVVAALAAFSRVHLSQHFMEDALVGSLIGTVIAYGVYRVLYRNEA